MKSNIYQYADYKKFLSEFIESYDFGKRGKRKNLAEAIGCQVSHVTNVLSGSGHFNHEQAEAAARFFGLNLNETEFLLLLIQYSRAGTESLKKFYERLILDRKEKYSNLKNQFKIIDSMKAEEEARYYSSWQMGAVHVLLSIPQFQNREAIAKKLELPISKIDDILSFLIDTGLCEKIGTRFIIKRPLIHLDKKSPLIAKHHINWRLRSILSLDQNRDEDLHYSSVFTLSEADYLRIRDVLTTSLSESMKIITSSPEENAAVICLDLFKL